MKIKPLIPTLREKKRYIVFEVISERKLPNNVVSKSIQEAMLNWFGIRGLAEAGIIFINERYDQIKQKGVLRVNRQKVNDVKAGLTLISQINNTPAFVRTVGVSGIVKKANAKYMA